MIHIIRLCLWIYIVTKHLKRYWKLHSQFVKAIKNSVLVYNAFPKNPIKITKNAMSPILDV